MTRFSYFLFNILLTIIIYSLVYLTGNDVKVLIYTITYFFAPYIAMNFLMVVISLVRWFFSQDPSVHHEGITFFNGTWVLALLTFGAYKLLTSTDALSKFFVITH